MKFIEKIKEILHVIRQMKHDNSETRLLVGALLAKNSIAAKSLRDAEFKVFSQFGDDGIIQFLINAILSPFDRFVEFGVENYEESNTRFLLMNNNWRGLVIDGSKDNINYIQKSNIYWRYDLTAVHSFITVDNINQILKDNGFDGRIGLLSIDIDGNDYWIWKAITVADADIVIAEYNSLLGYERAITIPYKDDFTRQKAHYSNLYFGASLLALCELAQAKGYKLVGCNQAGNNAYFIKNNLLDQLHSQSASEAFISARFREARDQSGELTYADEESRKNMIKGLPVVNVRTGLIEII